MIASLRRVLLRLYTVFRAGAADRDLARELDAHRTLIVDDFERRGMTRADAQLAAARAIGGAARVRDLHRDARSFVWIDDALRDVRYAARMLRRTPGVTAVAVLTLALATGATTAVYSVVNSVLFRPLPFAHPERLVQMYGRTWGVVPGDSAPDPMTGPVGFLEIEEFRTQSSGLAALAGYALTTRHLQDGGETERLRTVEAEHGVFSLLGVEPAVGRTFQTLDPSQVAVISARLWERRFNRDPSLPGRTITLDGRAFTIVGVMPEAFQFPYAAGSMMPGALTQSRTDLWIPLEVRQPSGEPRRGRVSVVARLNPGVSIDAASSELRVIAARLREHHPDKYRTYEVRLAPLADVVLRPVQRSLWMLLAAVGLVLAAACANVANLLLARMTARTREVATRAALGASRMRLVRQLLAESLLLSLIGGAFGAFIARWGARLLVVLGADRMPRAHEIALDWRTFAFLLVTCVVIAVLFGLAPAVAAASVDVQTVAKESSGHSTMGRRFGRLRDALVITEVALAFVLALGAALIVREVDRLQKAPTGMVTDSVLSLHLTPRLAADDYYAIERRVAALPGVQAAGFIQLVPLQNWGWEADFSIRGRVTDGRPQAGLRYVTPGYFRALGIPILRGRGFTDADTADAPRVVLINDALARRYFPGEDPVGRELDRGTIVGVVGDVRQVRLDRPAEPELYYAAAQNVTMASDAGMSLLVRSAAAPESLTAAVRGAVRDVNSRVAIFNVRTMGQVVADSLWELNLYRWAIGLFAALSLVLAAIGLYGVISYGVSSRTREFAVRLALGSDPIRLIGMVVTRGVSLTALGLAAGGVGAIAAAPLMQQLPSAVGLERLSVVAVCGLLLALAVFACIVPALRVARVNPAAALRHD
jgi:predicted permease